MGRAYAIKARATKMTRKKETVGEGKLRVSLIQCKTRPCLVRLYLNPFEVLLDKKEAKQLRKNLRQCLKKIKKLKKRG